MENTVIAVSHVRHVVSPVTVEGMPVDVDEDTYDEAIRLRLGWCPSCEEFTRPNVKPRARGLSCSECFDDRVSGAAHAKRAGFIWVQS